MKPRDTVQYVPNPGLYGRMVFHRVLPNGLIECLIGSDTWHASYEPFQAHELELAPALEIA